MSFARKSCGRTFVPRVATILSTLTGLLRKEAKGSEVSFSAFPKRLRKRENVLVQDDSIVSGPNIIQNELNKQRFEFLSTLFHLLPIHDPFRLHIQKPITPKNLPQYLLTHSQFRRVQLSEPRDPERPSINCRSEQNVAHGRIKV